MVMTLALPSKGRLREKALDVFARAGLRIVVSDDARSYRAKIAGHPDCEVYFLSASEIARELGNGSLDLGVTGQDLIYETLPNPRESVVINAYLGFGFADVVVAVPEVWYDVNTMADLDDVAAEFRHRHGRRLRIATKFWRLTQHFFSHKYGIQLYRIVESLGATEVAPAAGSADIIVDITSSGATLRANRLKILDDGLILKSQACLLTAVSSRDNARVSFICDKIRATIGLPK